MLNKYFSSVKFHMFAFTVLVVLATSLFCEPILAAEDSYLVLKITTRLGSEVDVDVHDGGFTSSIYVRGRSSILSNYDLMGFYGYPHKSRFILKLDDGLFILVPWQLFRQAEVQEDSHIVMLTDGTQYLGKFLTSVKGKDDAGNPKTYDLALSKKIELVKIAPGPSPLQGQPWELIIDAPTSQRFEGRFPRLAFPYSGFNRSIGVHKTGEFYIKVGNEEIPANLSDFKSLIFKKGDSITLEAASGQTTTGILKLTCCEDTPIGKRQPLEGLWMLLFEIKNGSIIAIEHPNGTIRKLLTESKTTVQSGRQQTHSGLQITVASVKRQAEWTDPRFKNSPPEMVPKIQPVQGFEVAVVIIKVKVIDNNHAIIPANQTWVYDIKGDKHKCSVIASDSLGESDDEDREFPFVVPRGIDLKTFYLTEEIFFDLTKGLKN